MKTKVLACVAVEKSGKFLLLKRSRSDSHPLLWEFPSGKVDEGESLEAAARRELMEEAGLEAKKLAYMGKSKRVEKESITIVHHFWTGSFSGEPKLSDEHEDFRWASREEILSLDKVRPGDSDFEDKIGSDALHYFGLDSSLKQCTLCLPVDFKNDRILLGLKKRGFGQGKWNGFGGKVEPGESPEKAALRELWEESGLKALHAEKVGELRFFFPHVPEEKGWDQTVHVFLARDWKGEPQESNEMRPEWFAFADVPFGKMWKDDIRWLPLVLEGKRVKASFVFAEDGESIKSMEIGEVGGF